MSKSSRLATVFVALIVVAPRYSAYSQEATTIDPASIAAETDASKAETAASVDQPDGPIRPKRGAPPTADRISGVTVEVNPDGTMERHVEVLGQPAPGLENSPPESASAGALPSDPSYTPPERATVSSINDEQPAEAKAATAEDTAAESSPRRDYILVAGAGVCVVIGLLLWWTMREPRKSN
jgi:hypothetical protein